MNKKDQIQMVKKNLPCEAIETTSVSQLGGRLGEDLNPNEDYFWGR